MITIQFKSNPENYEKERTGIKNNTVRKVTNEDKFQLLKTIPAKNLEIRIINTDTNSDFYRKVQDVTFWEDLVIITFISDPEKRVLEELELENIQTELIAEKIAKQEDRFMRSTTKKLCYMQHQMTYIRKILDKLVNTKEKTEQPLIAQ
jgi:hypothetical protein